MESSSKPPASSGRHILTILSVLSLVLCLALVALWVRSYYAADRLHGRVWGKRSFIVASKQGRITIVGFLWHGAANWGWDVLSYPAEDMMSFPLGEVRQYEKMLGFGAIRHPIYHVMRPIQETGDGTRIVLWGAATATLRGWGVIVPYWFLVLMAATSGILLRLRPPLRYSLRSLLLAVTLLAVVLAMAKTFIPKHSDEGDSPDAPARLIR